MGKDQFPNGMTTAGIAELVVRNAIDFHSEADALELSVVVDCGKAQKMLVRLPDGTEAVVTVDIVRSGPGGGTDMFQCEICEEELAITRRAGIALCSMDAHLYDSDRDLRRALRDDATVDGWHNAGMRS